MTAREIFIVAAARTAIGTVGGSLKDIPTAQLATTAVREAIKRNAVEAAGVGHVVMGNVIPTEPRDVYFARRRGQGPGAGARPRLDQVDRPQERNAGSTSRSDTP